MFWDYSDLPSDPFEASYSYFYLNPENQPGFDSFPEATHSRKNVDGTTISYYSYLEDSLSVLGFFRPLSDPEAYIYLDPRVNFEFPLTYNSTFSDEYERVYEESDISYWTLNGSVSVEVDGYGTLETPAGEFQDVLRLSIEDESLEKHYLNGEVIFTQVMTRNSVLFLNSDHKSLLHFTDTDVNGLDLSTTSSYLSSTGFSIDYQPTADDGLFSITPNPANSFIVLKDIIEMQPIRRIDLYSTDGRLIHQFGISETVAVDELRLELPSLQNGLYILRVKMQDRMYSKKVMVQQ